MNIIKDVKITDYKGIEEIHFPCESINIIVGPNNTGKSSILESIWMAVSSLDNFEDVLETTLDDVIDESHIKYLVHKFKRKSSVELELHQNDRIVLDLLYSDKKYPQEIEEFFLNFVVSIDASNNPQFEYSIDRTIMREEYRLMTELRRARKLYKNEESKDKLDEMMQRILNKIDNTAEKIRNELIQSEKVFLTSKANNKLVAIYTIMDAYQGEIPMQNEEILPISVIPLILSSPKIDEDLPELYTKLINTKKLAGVLETLRQRIPYFEDIRESDVGLQVLLENLDEPLPISFMGDGFKALLKLSFMAPLIKDGIVLFEEPEVSMHPGYLDILAKEIISSSKKSQFFISTHSLELVEYLLEKAEKANIIDSINIIRLRRLGNNYIDREICSGRDAKEEMELIKSDLRGY